jgi:guanylate kinase
VHTDAALEERLSNAQIASEIADYYDYVIWNNNGELEQAYSELASIVFDK